MKFRKLFLLALPLSLVGLRKIAGHAHGCGSHHHSGRHSRCGHMMKFISWRLGLTPGQVEKIEKLHTELKTECRPFSEKHGEVRDILMKEFRKEQFESEKLKGQFTPEMLGLAYTTFMKGIGEVHDILTPMQRDKLATLVERRYSHC